MAARRSMSGSEKQDASGMLGTLDSMDFIEPLRAALSRSDESTRYRLFAALLGELADRTQASGNGREGSAEQIELLTKKNQTLGEEKANLDDEVATLRADLEHRN